MDNDNGWIALEMNEGIAPRILSWLYMRTYRRMYIGYVIASLEILLACSQFNNNNDHRGIFETHCLRR